MGDTAKPSASEELEILRNERDALLENDISTWLHFVKNDATSLRHFQNSISWRITKPVRLVGKFSRKLKEVGIVATVSLALAAITARVRRRSR